MPMYTQVMEQVSALEKNLHSEREHALLPGDGQQGGCIVALWEYQHVVMRAHLL